MFRLSNRPSAAGRKLAKSIYWSAITARFVPEPTGGRVRRSRKVCVERSLGSKATALVFVPRNTACDQRWERGAGYRQLRIHRLGTDAAPGGGASPGSRIGARHRLGGVGSN